MDIRKFTDWESLAAAAASAPAEAGVIQVRVKDGLLDYPSGKSAMYFYGVATDLKQGIADFSDRLLPLLDREPPDLLARWLADAAPDPTLEDHMKRFEVRFGSLPHGNLLLLH